MNYWTLGLIALCFTGCAQVRHYVLDDPITGVTLNGCLAIVWSSTCWTCALMMIEKGLRASLEDPTGKTVKTYNAIGADSRSNMWGYGSAKDAGHDAFRQAMSDLLSQLDAEPLVK
jgi:hypothetical protein